MSFRHTYLYKEVNLMVRVSCLARVSTMKQHLSIDNHKELFDN
ncbi:MAG: hypothetical protein E6481_04185 [Clostridium perfringens]|nr:hypothetical protein [Clostridium perfringens]MDU6634204.1 hypothetical protein [Clostridium perfringens]